MGIKGKNKECKYYPCHKDLEDCTWCYCPFYPCGDTLTGGRWKKHSRTDDRVFSCVDCTWIHEDHVARRVLDGIKSMGTYDKKEVQKLRKALLGELK